METTDPPTDSPASPPVDGQTLAAELRGVFNTHVGLPEDADVALVLWTLHAHAHDAFMVSPILAVMSPEKRCGKSTLLNVLQQVVPRPQLASNISRAAVYRLIDSMKPDVPTLIVDEADTFVRHDPELIGILNSGHTRLGAKVVRVAF